MPISENCFSYFSTKTYVVGTQKNHLNETFFFEHTKHMFRLMGKKKMTILRSENFLFDVWMCFVSPYRAKVGYILF